MAFYLIECEMCGEEYTGSRKTKSRSRANNYKSMQRKFVNKETERGSSKASSETKILS